MHGSLQGSGSRSDRGSWVTPCHKPRSTEADKHYWLSEALAGAGHLVRQKANHNFLYLKRSYQGRRRIAQQPDASKSIAR